MKKFFFSVAALAAAMTFTACSSDDILSGADNTGAEWDENGNGYVAVNINLPVDQRTSSRANDKFKDGTAEEYAVNSVTLLVFGNNVEDEQDAVFAGAYPLNLTATSAGGDMVSGAWGPSTDGQNGTGNENITVHNQAVAKISRMGGQYAYILAALNTNGHLTVEGNELKIDGVKFEGTFADFCKLVNNDELDLEATDFHGTNGFFMTNAPMSDLQGGENNPSGAKVHVLAHVDRSQIKASKEDAIAAATDPVNPKVAAQVYVERAVAKVTLSGAVGAKVDGTNINWGVTEWSLDNTNKSSYIVRNIEGMTDWFGYKSGAASVVDGYRFVGTKKAEAYVFPGTNQNLWRTYFTKDTNYDFYDANSFNYVGDNHEHIARMKWHGTYTDANPNAGYCAENTFNVRNQIWGATTRVIVKATLNDGNDFYAVEGTNTILTPDAAKAAAEAAYLETIEAWYNAEGQYYLTSYNTAGKLTFDYSNDGKNKADKKPEFSATWDPSAFVFADKQTVANKLNTRDFGGDDWSELENPHTHHVYTEEPAGWHKPENVTVMTIDDVPAYSNNVVNLCVYENGVTYYQTRIKHFGEDGCPWNSWETGANKPSVSAGAYPGSVTESEKNYLGRWGVLRNNWYDLNVTKISKIGSATVPTLKGDERNTDDELDQYIAVDVNILSWAYRGQNIEF